jgi:hypothetical protein
MIRDQERMGIIWLKAGIRKGLERGRCRLGLREKDACTAKMP